MFYFCPMNKMDRNKKRLLKAIVKSRGHVNNACAIAGVTVMTLSNYRRNDPSFKEQFEQLVIDQKSRFGEDLTQAFINKTLGEKKALLDDDGEEIKDEYGNTIYEYMGGDTVAMIWASKNTPMQNGQAWSDKQHLQVESGGKTLMFLPADQDVAYEEVKEISEETQLKE